MAIMNKYGIPQQTNPNKMQIQPVNYFDPRKFIQPEQPPVPVMQPKPVDFQGGPQRMPPEMMPPQLPPQIQPPMGINPSMDFNPSPFANPSPFDNSGFDGGLPEQYRRMLLQQYLGNSGMRMY